MTATQYVVDNIILSLGGTVVVTAALSTFLGKIWSTRIINREKAKLDSEIQTIKDNGAKDLASLKSTFDIELLRRDQFHELSKSTYEKIFDKRVEVYTELLELRLVFEKFRNEDGSFRFINPTEGYHQRFNDIRQAIEKNRLYITNQLAEAYDNWYREAAQYIRQIDEIEYEEVSCAVGPSDINTMQRILERQESVIEGLVTKTFIKMDTLINQIEKDVSLIRTRMAVNVA